jgi:hypothetical protein
MTKLAFPTSVTARVPSAVGRPMQLVEEKVFVQIDGMEEEKDCRCWVLDTGATNHMMRCSSAFNDLDSNIRSTVKFGDGSSVQIEGVLGTILFHCKNGEH